MFFFIFVNAIAEGFFYIILDDFLQCFPQASKRGINLFKSTYTIPLVGGDSWGG